MKDLIYKTLCFFLLSLTQLLALEDDFYDTFLKEKQRIPEVLGAKKFKTPLEQRSLIVREGEYFPQKIIVHQGSELELHMTSLKTPNACVFIKDLNFFTGLDSMQVMTKKVKLDKAGTFKIYCPSIKGSAQLVVLPNSDSGSSNDRSIASVKEEGDQSDVDDGWRPKEHEFDI